MQPRIIAVVVARSGADRLQRTLAAIAAQTRAPDILIAVDGSSKDGSEALLSTAGATHVLTVRDGTSFGSSVAHAVSFAPPVESDGEWLWLLGHDNAPDPDALSRLLGAVEIAPSVGIAGPKLMSTENPAVISEFGQTISRFGATVSLVDDELDQAQHDTRDDVLGVSAAGMLVRRSLWSALGGFDPGLPSIDASLDFSIRARLAGYRVILVPAARVASDGGPELFGRGQSSAARTFRIARAAQLHRRLVYSPAWAVVLHWLSLVPLGVVRALGDLVGKRPSAIGGELGAAFSTAFSAGIGVARRNLKRSRTVGWSAIAPLRMPTSEVRERRAQAREAALLESDPSNARALARTEPRAGFVSNGGFWVVVLVGIVGVLAYGTFLGATAISGGALRPLSASVPALWGNIGIGWREVGSGVFGAADPFAAVLAVLGSLTFWAPSFSVVLVYFLAMPLSALGAWFAARRITRSLWMPALAGIVWAFAPPLLAALASGRLGAIVAHILLPWLVLASLGAARSWASGAAAALLFAAVAAGAPSIVPALLVLFVVLLVTHPTRIHRTIGIPIPAIVLFGPLVVQQMLAGNPLGLLADPGVPLASGSASGWQLALGDATGTLLGWPAALSSLGIPGGVAPVLVIGLCAPLVILALLALFLPGARRAIFALFVAFLGYATAVLAGLVQVGAVGSEPMTVWAGSGLSVFWMGLTAAAILAIGSLGRAVVPVSTLAGLAAVALAIPLLGAMFVGTALIHPSNGRILPALVSAQAASSPSVGTLVVSSLGETGVAVRLERGLGASLDDQSTLVSTKRAPDALDRRLAVLAGNLSARSGFDYSGELTSLGVSFILVPGAPDDDETHRSLVDALDGNESLTPVGTTTTGLLWRFEASTTPPSVHPTNTGTSLGSWYLVALGIVFGVTVLLAIPIGGRPRAHRNPAPTDERAETFDEEEHG
ncbi:GT2 family glycosyltransferase [Cryobacterium mesophilum]|uniref:glycosyltransferase family 2 protein n=1 Tax=Terrimesophilobacter mesophilus TaxID=433647 RepID=UPI0014256717|nr:glycosyltransferase family 2 protein [Terrimesophilobacter mesophilus]MBB5632640.1 GT2 family glycosyltransferase [Terrimesophilobacter mesophilus]